VAEPSSNSSPLGCIVIADDDDDVRDLLAYRFEQQGYEVVTACDGAEMIRRLEEVDTPVAIFVDLLMPGIVGGSVVDFIRSEPRLANVPTAIVTGSAELAPKDATVFRKPVPFDVLLGFVQAAGGLTGCKPEPSASRPHLKS
jgi:CheY-like chemotaxis protein